MADIARADGVGGAGCGADRMSVHPRAPWQSRCPLGPQVGPARLTGWEVETYFCPMHRRRATETAILDGTGDNPVIDQHRIGQVKVTTGVNSKRPTPNR
jgi:hypothetical protein